MQACITCAAEIGPAAAALLCVTYVKAHPTCLHACYPSGAEQRAYDLEDRLRNTQRQAAGFDEAQSSLIEQSQILVCLYVSMLIQYGARYRTALFCGLSWRRPCTVQVTVVCCCLASTPCEARQALVWFEVMLSCLLVSRYLRMRS